MSVSVQVGSCLLDEQRNSAVRFAEKERLCHNE
jgi:hypothetical protein